MKKTLLWIISLTIVVIIGLILFGYNAQPSPFPKSSSDKVKSALSNERAYYGIYTDEKNDFCINETVLGFKKDIQDASKNIPKCFSDTDSWVAASIAYTDKDAVEPRYWCVDSNGASKGITTDQYTAIVDANTLCP